ncbi:SDR family NAD(P)-dependent oxidoreductase [Streptomyces sp. NPDC014882]|uniref:SDR family NAD(P)-dependent oxidoreductase n=1 Tax=Streptomyces sp. NPDC014882 TaxID=3364927 RepID=UPI0036FFB82D
MAIVTGGAAGIGAATARLFAAEGASVVVADIADAEGEEPAAELGPPSRYAHLDVSDGGG